MMKSEIGPTSSFVLQNSTNIKGILMNSYFVIIGSKMDNPIYEVDFGSGSTAARGGTNATLTQNLGHLNQFIIHSSLDIVDEVFWGTQSNYLKIVDRFNEWNVSAYITPSGSKFLLLHDALNSDGIRHFFTDVHELYIKCLLNPFMDINAQISNTGLFDTRVKALGRKWLV